MSLLVAVAAFAAIPLTLAVIAHEGSTLLVAANGLRLLAGRPHVPTTPAGWTPEGPPARAASDLSFAAH